jgi:predicted MPP superfamily phosphohydrolase
VGSDLQANSNSKKEYNTLIDTIIESPKTTDLLIVLMPLIGLITQVGLALITTRHQGLAIFAILGIIFIFICQALVIYGSFIAPRRIQIVRKNINLNNEKKTKTTNLKIIVAADFHVGPFKKNAFVEKIVKLINRENPDLVVMPGDFVFSHEQKKEQVEYMSPIKNIKAKYGVFATLGNHDYELFRIAKLDFLPKKDRSKCDYIAKQLEKFGIQVLRNEIKEILPNVKIAGLEDIWGNTGDFNDVFNKIKPQEHVILLEHNPDIILDKRNKKADLVISGHTHAGQIRLPIIGPLYGIPTKLNNKYSCGLFNLKHGNKLYITKGAGEAGTRARLFSSPEIVVLNVKL